jgi:hypothetical protein
MTSEEAGAKSTALVKSPFHYRFHELKFQTFSVSSSTTASSFVLSGLIGLVDHFFFVVRTANPTGSQQWTYTQITSWELLDSSSTNIVGGSALKDTVTRSHLGRLFSESSYLQEPQYLYMYSFSIAPSVSYMTGQNLNTYRFRGNETLKINFASSVSGVQVDVFANCPAILEFSNSQIRKLSV